WRSVPNRSREEVNEGLDDVGLNKNKNVKMLKLLVKSRKEAISELENLCASLLQMNMRMVREIVDTDMKSFSCARDILTEHRTLGKYIASLNNWSIRQMLQAKDGLNDAETAAAKRCSALGERLTKVEAKLAKARAEWHALKTYKEKEFPALGLKTTAIEKEISKLRETQQRELEDVSRVCQTAMADLEKRYKAQEEEILSAVAEVGQSWAGSSTHRSKSYRLTNFLSAVAFFLFFSDILGESGFRVTLQGL
uniref:Uncharacterized protein n=1 Tax=Scleropages formosus TaxID=113540 RepID=A0A8C9R5J9_SCLFO